MKDSKQKSKQSADNAKNESCQSQRGPSDNVPQVPNRAHTEMRSDSKKAKG